MEPFEFRNGDKMSNAEEHEPTAEELKNEVEKWKNFSRVWEERAKEAKKQAEEPKKNEDLESKKSLTAAEVQQLIQAERQKAQKDFAIETARKELSEAASQAGFADISEFIDMSKFVGEDGNLSADKLTAFVSSLTKAAKKPSWGYSSSRSDKPSQSKGLGRFM